MAYSIVVGYDGSEAAQKALDVAVELAKSVPDGEIVIACAEDRSAAGAHRWEVGPGPEMGRRGVQVGPREKSVGEYWELLARKTEADLAEAAARAGAAGVKVATACTKDRADETIIKVARESGARIIVVGAKGSDARPGESTALGSTTSRVLHEKGDIPVLVV
jgi:nucleotide-binding universal stress UspA family protein